jgi:hypothetical protein
VKCQTMKCFHGWLRACVLADMVWMVPLTSVICTIHEEV